MHLEDAVNALADLIQGISEHAASEAQWKERIFLVTKLGECVGALQGLRHQVDEACRARIDKLLEDIGDPSVLWRGGEHAASVSSEKLHLYSRKIGAQFPSCVYCGKIDDTGSINYLTEACPKAPVPSEKLLAACRAAGERMDWDWFKKTLIPESPASQPRKER